jgi:flagellar hook-associated protein 2
MALAAPGIGSNLDVNSIVSQLISVERQPITVLNQREAGIQAKITAFGTLKGALSSFQSAAQGLSDIGKYLAYSASSGDTTVATVSASPQASAASYALDVTTLAQAQKLTATGQAATNTAIGNGTLTFDFGTISGGSFNTTTGQYTGAAFASNGSGSKSVTIDSSNNSLQGIRDAINNANIGVTASIVNDGNATTPYRLVLSSANSGVANSVKISVSGDAALSNLLANDPAGTQNLAQSITAQNATFKVDGVSISKSSNTVTDVIAGVTFALQKPAASTTLTVARDTQTVKNSVQAFVNAYNSVNKNLSDASAYNAATQKGAILQGDSAVRNIQNQIRNTLTSTLTGLGGNLSLLSQVGVSFQKDGSLALDSTKLQSAIDNNFSDIPGLFAATGKSTDSLVQFAASSTDTQPGNYAVAITQVATQGKSIGAKDVSGGVTIGATNNTLNVTVDGVAATLTLDAGTYTSTTLASQIQSKINGATALSSAGAAVSVAVSGNTLAITSSRYGAGSNVSVTGGSAQVDVFGTGVDTGGLDVAGTIGGATATGLGQALTGTGNAAGLRINITGGSTGSRGSVNYAQGYAYKLNQLVNNFVQTGGVIAARTDGLAKSVTDIGAQRDALNLRINNLETRLRAQFTSLDSLVSKFTATGSFLTQQLANLPGFTAK